LRILQHIEINCQAVDIMVFLEYTFL